MKHNVSRDCLVFIFFNFLIRIILAIRFNDINMRFSVSENRSYEVLNVLTRTFLIRKSHSRHFLGHAKKKMTFLLFFVAQKLLTTLWCNMDGSLSTQSMYPTRLFQYTHMSILCIQSVSFDKFYYASQWLQLVQLLLFDTYIHHAIYQNNISA